MPEERVAIFRAAMAEAYRVGLEDATKDVCSYCAGRALPDDKAAHVVHGPNEARNYTHRRTVGDGWAEVLCDASAIHSRIRGKWMPACLAEKAAT